MVSLTSKLAAAGGLVFLALSLVATANADAHAPFALTRSTVGHGEGASACLAPSARQLKRY